MQSCAPLASLEPQKLRVAAIYGETAAALAMQSLLLTPVVKTDGETQAFCTAAQQLLGGARE